MNIRITLSIGIVFLLIFNIPQVKAQEKVSLTTDRDIYIAGEEIWFSLGVLELSSNENSKLSNILYVELLNGDHTPIIKLKYRVEKDIVQSKVQLPDSLSTGKYYIRAYTRWMRNRDVSLYACKIFSVINPFVPKRMPQGDKYFSRDTVFCYPEGEKLLSNVKNKLLFYVCGKNGNPITKKVKIKDQNDNISQEFVSEATGFVSVNFIPQESVNYYLDYDDHKVDLKKISQNGCLLQLAEDRDDFLFKVIGYCSNEMRIDILSNDGKYLKSYKLSSQNIIRIKKSELPSISMYALLIDDAKIIHAYRGFTNSNNDKLIKIFTDRELYGVRDIVNVDIKNIDSLRHLSVSVVKSSLLNSTAKEDYVLTANDKMILKKQPLFFLNDTILLPEIEGELLSGEIRCVETNNPIKNEQFILSFISDSPIIDFVETDSAGRFVFVVNRYGEEEMVIQPKSMDTKKINYRVILDDSFSTKYPKNKLGELIIDTLKMRNLNEAIVNMQINSIYKPNKSTYINSVFNNAPFYKEAINVIDIEKYIELPTMEEIIREVVPHTSLKKNKKGYDLRVVESRSFYPKNGNTLIFVDGVPIKDTQKIFEIKPQDLDRIEVVNLQFFIKGENLGYLLCLYTKNNNMADMEFDSRIFRQVHKGYEYEYKFNSLDYSNLKTKNSRLADFRNTLYFNTFESKELKSPLNFKFYTSDEETEYIITVRGINKYGKVIESKKNLKVCEKN
ncbi:hypothetical protein DF185_14255 [Marinifilum breve]|uniref:TonB-dependent receptor plug domain-containing protein n=1 Tax=Marinifilum breve TaxID=2184082 RepID=A0A2V3ZVC6_9BACT|nr:hypothetical protein [Marinifilum breve]PXX99040.1 hypothetical protein DF185_14255 [Marinifilum breve]